MGGHAWLIVFEGQLVEAFSGRSVALCLSTFIRLIKHHVVLKHRVSNLPDLC